MADSGAGPSGFSCDADGDKPTEIEAKAPVPVQPDGPSLARLPPELIANIVELAGEILPDCLDDISLVSTYFYTVASTARYRDVSLPLYNVAAARRKLESVSQKGHLPFVKTLRIIRGQLPEENEASTVALAIDVLPEMQALRNLYWTGSFVPDQLMKQLRRLPGVQLHMTLLRTGEQPIERNPHEMERLAECLNLVSLEVHVVGCRRGDVCCHLTACVKTIALSCPRLRRLHVDIEKYIVEQIPTTAGGFGLNKEELLPPLRELTLKEYYEDSFHRPWVTSPSMSDRNRTWLVPEAEAQHWVDQPDWSQLRRLGDITLPLARKLGPRLTGLQHLEFTLQRRNPEDVILKLLNAVPARLLSVRIHVPLDEKVLAALKRRHGKTLRSLAVHRPVLGRFAVDELKSVLRSIPNNGFLIRVRSALPQLEILSLDVDHRRRWPYDLISNVARFPSLRELHLRFSLFDQEKDCRPTRPCLTAKVAMQLAEHLGQLASPTLRLVRLFNGETPFGKSSRLMAAQGNFPHMDKLWTSFVLERPGPCFDGESRLDLYVPRCERLNRTWNERLWRCARGEEEVTLPVKGESEQMRSAFEMALEGFPEPDPNAAPMISLSREGGRRIWPRVDPENPPPIKDEHRLLSGQR